MLFPEESRFYLYVSIFLSSSGCVGGCCVASVPWSPLHRISLPNKQEAQGGRDLPRWLSPRTPLSSTGNSFLFVLGRTSNLSLPIRVCNTASPFTGSHLTMISRRAQGWCCNGCLIVNIKQQTVREIKTPEKMEWYFLLLCERLHGSYLEDNFRSLNNVGLKLFWRFFMTH